jgi:hypothetical protein
MDIRHILLLSFFLSSFGFRFRFLLCDTKAHSWDYDSSGAEPEHISRKRRKDVVYF